jgi:hypothetical protein
MLCAKSDGGAAIKRYETRTETKAILLRRRWIDAAFKRR